MTRPLDIALSLIAEGIAPVPVAFRGKAPRASSGAPLKSWQKLRIGAADAVRYFDGLPQNVGALLGEPSGWLTDIDLDCPEAIRAAPYCLPPTRRQGRSGAPDSHWFYVARGSVLAQFRDPMARVKKRSMVLEIRSTGAQTVMAGSVHESGEAISWTNPHASFATVDWPELQRAAGDLAAAALLGRYWMADADRAVCAAVAVGALRAIGCEPSRAGRIARGLLAAAGTGSHDLDAALMAEAGSWEQLVAMLRPEGALAADVARIWLGAPVDSPLAPATAPADAETPRLAAISHAARIERAKRWLAKVPPEAHGDGSLQLVRTAAMLARGFALGEQAAFELLRTSPLGAAWSPEQLHQRCADAMSGPRGGGGLPWGFKLLAEPPARDGARPHAARTAKRTDVENAERLVSLFGDDLRYVGGWGKGLAWQSNHWAIDDGSRWQLAAIDTARTMYGEARAALDDAERRGEEKAIDEAKKTLSWAATSQGASRIAAMAHLARSSPKIAITHDRLDGDEWLLNVSNGTVDLRTGELRPHRRDDLMTKVAQVDFVADAEAPVWMAFLHRAMAGDVDLVAYLQRLVGYALTGSVREHVLAFFYGGGANGKSTFLATIHALLGDYATPAPRGMLFRSRSERHPTELATLFGRRFVTCSEIEEGQTFDEALTKDLTGGDRVECRRMREDFWTFSPTHKLFLAGNHKPTVRGDDEGIWRRMRLVPWTVTIPQAERDPALPEKLRGELPGILRWAIEGCLAWQRDGLDAPEAVRAATSAYRTENDALGEFLRLHVAFERDKTVARRELRQAYEVWCGENGHVPFAAKRFAARLRENGVGDATVRRGVKVLDGWKNVRLLDDNELAERVYGAERVRSRVGTSSDDGGAAGQPETDPASGPSPLPTADAAGPYAGSSPYAGPYSDDAAKYLKSNDTAADCRDVGTCRDHPAQFDDHAHAHTRDPGKPEIGPYEVPTPYSPTEELFGDWLMTEGIGPSRTDDTKRNETPDDGPGRR